MYPLPIVKAPILWTNNSNTYKTTDFFDKYLFNNLTFNINLTIDLSIVHIYDFIIW